MQAARFFIDAPLAPDTEIELPANVAHHAVRVLRLRDDEPIVLFNGTGGEWRARLSIQGKRSVAAIQAFDPIERESDLTITLVQSWIATDKLDWVIEKSVELGVHSIVLCTASRSVIQLDSARLAKRLSKLRELVIAACCQSGRNRVPEISAAPDVGRALQLAMTPSTSGVLLDPTAALALTSTVATGATSRRFAVAVGPEGGFSEIEISEGVRIGYCRYALGPRTLRTETAGLAAIATLQAVAGDFGVGRNASDIT